MESLPHPPPVQPPESRPPASGPHWLARQHLMLAYRAGAFAALCRRGWRSLGQRGLLPTLRLALRRLFPARRLPFPLQLYPDQGRVAIHLPNPAAPRASIIVPVHGQLALTLGCLHALAAAGDDSSFEVIVVDDASPDASGDVLPGIDGLRYLRNEHNLGFIGSCNAGASHARGEFLVLLNNDTLVQPGWLDSLLSTFERFPDTGLAGSKLVYPDGRLQEAGGIVFQNGRPANYGRNGDPSDPRYNFVREVDYCSGAAIALPTALFRELDGLDAHYAPAYFEDTDLAMRVRRLGLKVRYQPASVVVHLEGASSGTDEGKGIKAWQPVNAGRFRERWAEALQQHPREPDPRLIDDSGMDLASRHRQPRRVLVLDSITPTPDRDSGSLRMAELLGLLVEEGCSVVFLPQNLGHDGVYTEALQQRGVEVWWQPWIRDLPRWLARHGREFDAVIVSRHYVLKPVLNLLQELAPQAQRVFDTVDLHFLREQREAEHEGRATALQAAANTRRIELDLIRQVDLTWVVSETERELLAQLAPQARVGVVSNIHRLHEDTLGPQQRRDLVFVGGFRHPPNVDAALWLGKDIFPRIRSALPDVRLKLVGADAPAEILQLGQQPGIDVLGHVPELEPLLDASRISLAPLRYGAGIKGKVNQSLARGLPVVATPCAVEGMFLHDGRDVLVADNAEDFATCVVRLYGDDDLWSRLREAGFENTREHFSRDAARAALHVWLATLPVRED